MKKIVSVLFLFATLVSAGFRAQAQICTVTDPTGTPLNVRTAPNGRIVGKLRNGTVVTVEDYTTDAVAGRVWAQVGVTRKGKYVVLGYVLEDFLTCKQ